MKSIKVVVGPGGEVKIDATGFEGRSCVDETREIETALGVTTGSRMKAEAYSQAKVESRAEASKK